jgi:hypothetical protein
MIDIDKSKYIDRMMPVNFEMLKNKSTIFDVEEDEIFVKLTVKSQFIPEGFIITLEEFSEVNNLMHVGFITNEKYFLFIKRGFKND